MSYFPMYIDLEKADCLVIGGGVVAYRKVCVLKEFGAKVTVVAGRIDERIKHYTGTVHCLPYEIDLEEVFSQNKLVLKEKDSKEKGTLLVEDYRLVVAATDDYVMNHEIAELCKRKNIPVNAVDQQEDCSFIFPSYFKTGKLTMAITTSGSSPYYAAQLREKLQNEIPDMTEDFLEQMSLVRIKLKERIVDSKARGRILKKMVLFAMEHNRILTDEEIAKFVECMGNE